jgi:hypothetical protein
MTIDELRARHHEGLHPCLVIAGPAGNLVVTCRACGSRLEADLLSPCVGGRHDSRVILVLRCPACGKTGQLRFTKEAPWIPLPPPPPSAHATVSFRGGGAGYLSCSCSCGGGGGFYYQDHLVQPGALHVRGVVEGCGHRVTATLPCGPSFLSAPHRHGQPRGT